MITLPASLFRSGHTYRLYIEASAPGYQNNSCEYGVSVLPAEDQVDENIVLSRASYLLERRRRHRR